MLEKKNQLPLGPVGYFCCDRSDESWSGWLIQASEQIKWRFTLIK